MAAPIGANQETEVMPIARGYLNRVETEHRGRSSDLFLSKISRAFSVKTGPMAKCGGK